jgi:hypothetical protein
MAKIKTMLDNFFCTKNFNTTKERSLLVESLEKRIKGDTNITTFKKEVMCKIIRSFIFRNKAKNSVDLFLKEQQKDLEADILAIKLLGISYNSQHHINSQRDKPTQNSSYIRLKPKNAHQLKFVLDLMTFERGIQLYLKEESSIRVRDGIMCNLFDNILIAKNEKYDIFLVEGSIKSILSKLEYDDTEIEYLIKVFKNTVQGGINELTVKKIDGVNNFEGLKSYLSSADIEKFKKFFKSKRRSKQYTYQIDTSDKILEIEIYQPRKNFTPLEKKMCKELFGGKCVYCGATIKNGIYYNYVKSTLKSLLIAEGKKRLIPYLDDLIEVRHNVAEMGSVDHADLTATEGNGIGIYCCIRCGSEKGTKTF